MRFAMLPIDLGGFKGLQLYALITWDALDGFPIFLVMNNYMFIPKTGSLQARVDYRKLKATIFLLCLVLVLRLCLHLHGHEFSGVIATLFLCLSLCELAIVLFYRIQLPMTA
jgi:hypothetical protein